MWYNKITFLQFRGIKMNILCTITTDILHIIKILIICKAYLGLNEKIEDKYRYIKILAMTSIMSIVISVIENQTITLIIYLVYLEIVLQICYSEEQKKLLIYGMWVAIIAEIINMFLKSIVNIIESLLGGYSETIENLIASILSVLFVYCVSILLRRITNRDIGNIGIRYLVGFTVILVADFIILMLMAAVTLDEIAYKNKVIYVICYTAVVIGIFIQIAAVILLLASRNIYKEKEKVVSNYLEEQIKYYKYLEKKEKETKKFRHDIRSHLYILNKLKKENKDKEFNNYFQEILERVDDLGNYINVQNDIVNAVLNKAYQEAKAKGIHMKVEGHFPAKCNISAYNLCTIFFNLMNNAIEAAERTDKKKIWVICQYTNKEIIVEIGNYFSNNIVKNKGKLVTTKAGQDLHGWGINNVEESVINSGGLMDIEIKDNKFIVSLTLNNR